MKHAPDQYLAATPDGYSPLLSRRSLLGSGLLLTAFATATPAASAPTHGTLTSTEPMRLLLKLQASLVAASVPWFYTGRIYAVRGATAPLHLVDFEGSEIYWVHPQANNQWQISASTLTFYRDIQTGAYLDLFANPLTGQSVQVTPNVLRTRPGNGMTYAANGMTAFGQTYPWDIELHRSGDLQWLTTSRAILGAPQPSLETQSMFGSVKEIDDPKRSQVAAHFSSTTFSPWSRWMNMGSNEGHLVWHAAGRKLARSADLPADYRARAEAIAPTHFSDPEQDPTPLPAKP